MQEVIVYQIDSFTKEKFKGNPAGVVLNAEHMTSEENGPLGGYLIQNKNVETSDDIFEFTGKQGEAINRVGKVKVSVNIKDSKPDSVSITGNAVCVFRTTMGLH